MTDHPTSRRPRARKPPEATPPVAAPRRSRVTTADAPTATPAPRATAKKSPAAPKVAPATDEAKEPAQAKRQSTVKRTSSARHLRAVPGDGKSDDTPAPPPPPVAPEGMGVHGKRLWRDVVEVFVLRPDELVVLASACFAEERVYGIREELAKMDILVRGSMGQLVANPLLTEVRAHEGHVAAMLAKLKLRDVASGTAQGRSEGARTAAKARWATPHGAPS